MLFQVAGVASNECIVHPYCSLNPLFKEQSFNPTIRESSIIDGGDSSLDNKISRASAICCFSNICKSLGVIPLFHLSGISFQIIDLSTDFPTRADSCFLQYCQVFV